jgi:DNA polymerase I-like protein with 3'-5' exonuclease and polymerase domains
VKTWSVDAEWGWRHGDVCPSGFTPLIFCGTCLETNESFHAWGRDPRLAHFIRDHADDLFVSHNMVSEVLYLHRVGVRPPTRWFCTMCAYRYLTNTERVARYNLVEAVLKSGLPHSRGGEEKEAMQKRLKDLRLDPDNSDDRRQIRDYCFEDCADAALLYRHLVGRIPPLWMNYIAKFCLSLALMETRGIGIDMRTYGALLERREEVIEAVTADVNTTARVFVNGSLSKERFFRWCAANNIGWPTSVSPRTGLRYLPLDDETLENMEVRHPFIAAVRQANKTVRQLTKRSLAVDPVTGRHFFGDIPVAQSTGRTSFTGFLLSCPKWMRHLAVPSPGHALVSVDYTAEEILIAGFLSHDEAMVKGYASGDSHMAFAIAAGAAPKGATKRTHEAVRALYKTVNLAVNYGQTEYGISQRTGIPLQQAKALLDQHGRTFATYTSWARNYVLQAFREHECHTVAGWRRRVDRHDNPRSVANFPVQGSGSDLMRLTVVYLTRNGLQLLATNHDGFLLQCPCDQVAEARVAIDAALRQAVEQLLPGVPMRWTLDVFKDRYHQPEEKAKALWNRICGVLSRRTAAKVVVAAGS